MNYNKEKLEEVISALTAIQEYDYITYPDEDNEKAKDILDQLYVLTMQWKKMHDENYGY